MSTKEEIPATDPFEIPRETTPAWESELLLSIGLVVAMLQLSPAVDGVFRAWSPQLNDQWLPPLMYGYLYTKAAIYGLIVTFVAHLTTRGFWVALVGTRAVYPAGIQWDKLRQGPITKAYARERLPNLARPIEAIDNFASLIFASGFLIVGMTLQVLLIVVVVSLISGAVSVAFFAGKHLITLTLAIFGVLILPLTIAGLIDRKWGSTLAADGKLARCIRGVNRWSAPLFSPPWTTPMMLVLSSRVGPVKTTIALSLMLYLLIFSAGLTLAQIRGKVALDNYGYATVESGSTRIDPAHYADQRSQTNQRFVSAPFIPSEYLNGPYLRLFVPYRPRHDTELMTQACPDLNAKKAKGADEIARQAAILKCAARLYAPRLNGAALENLSWLFAIDPGTEQRGFVTMIAVGGLAAGPHLLSVRQPRTGDDSSQETDTEAADTSVDIPFWK